MGYIFGGPFDDYVDKQIKVRQEKLGSTTYDNDLISYTTSKDSWLRLTSGVNVTQNRLDTLPGSQSIPEGSGLAKRYVLFGGANNVLNSSKPKGGIIGITESGGNKTTYNNSLLENVSYGFDSTAEYGLTPLPGITSFNVKPITGEGSVFEGEIQIKCYNVQQFNHIESLYLRLGYTLLLEWGHTVYFKNDGTLETEATSGNQVYKDFLEGIKGSDKDPQTYILNKIQQTRSGSSGNYDGMVGRVLNYDWEVTPQGEYNIKIKVLSPGSIAESLSIANALPGSVISLGDNETTGNSQIESSAIGRILTGFKKCLGSELSWYQPGLWNGDETPLGIVVKNRPGPNQRSNAAFFTFSLPLSNNRIKDSAELPDVIPYNDDVFNPSDLSTLLNPISIKELVLLKPTNGDKQYYIKFGALLRILQNFLQVYNTSAESYPMIPISWKYEDNKCFIPIKNLFSSDPRVCLIPSKCNAADLGSGYANTVDEFHNFSFLNKGLGEDFLSPNDYEFNFMHIHLNIDLILELLTKNTNNSGEVFLIDFLLALCTQVNSSLSNTTVFAPFIDTTENILYIVNKRNSDLILPDPSKPPSKFQIGFHKTNTSGSIKLEKGSFVTNVSINSTIPPNFTEQIAIGAQANNNSTNPDSFAFSKWNTGYTDRIVLDKNPPISPQIQQAASAKIASFENTKKNIATAIFYNAQFSYGNDLYQLNKDINDYFKIKSSDDIKNSNGKLTPPTLIPISLSLTMDGLSGMKMLEKYTITDQFLPLSYRENIEFTINGINHTIDGSGWITKIEGQFHNKSKLAIPTSTPATPLRTTTTLPNGRQVTVGFNTP
tara:strand:- start:728 stop:3214 length:2487 start_codon:yes stop_codon:yes gene_type:complete